MAIHSCPWPHSNLILPGDGLRTLSLLIMLSGVSQRFIFPGDVLVIPHKAVHAMKVLWHSWQHNSLIMVSGPWPQCIFPDDGQWLLTTMHLPGWWSVTHDHNASSLMMISDSWPQCTFSRQRWRSRTWPSRSLRGCGSSTSPTRSPRTCPAPSRPAPARWTRRSCRGRWRSTARASSSSRWLQAKSSAGVRSTASPTSSISRSVWEAVHDRWQESATGVCLFSFVPFPRPGHV